jgi:hypothetical protein
VSAYWDEDEDGYDPDDFREPDESAYLDAQAQHDYELHCMRVHNGAHCDCEVGDPARFLRADDPGFTAGPPPF